MSNILKPFAALAITVLLFFGYSYLMDEELLDFVQTRFYNPAVVKSYVNENTVDAKLVQDYIIELQDKFAETLMEQAVRNSFMYNQSPEDIYERSRIFGILLESISGLQSVQFVDRNGIRIHFSTSARDIINQNRDLTAYRNYDEDPLSVPYETISVEESGSPKYTMDENGERIIFSFPFNDSMDVYRGTAIFNMSIRALSERLVFEGRLKVSDDVSVIEDPPGILLAVPETSRAEIHQRAAEIWREDIQGRVTLDSEDSGMEYSLISTKTSQGIYLGRLINDYLFSISEQMKLILELTIFVTFFLTLFFLFNLKPNPVTVVRTRIKRLRDNLFEQLYINKTNQERAKWILELEQRRIEIRAELKSGMKLRSRMEANIDGIINKSWDELLNVIKSGSIVLPPSGIIPAAIKTDEGIEEAEAIDEVEAIEEAEALDEVETIDEVEEIEEAEGLEEIDQAEELEDIDEAEEITETNGLEEIDEAEEIEEIEEIDEIAEANELEEISDTEEIEEIQEVDEIAEAAALDEIDDTEEIEEIHEVDEIAEADELEEIDDSEDLEEIREVNEIDEADELEEIDETEAEITIEAKEIAVTEETIEEIDLTLDDIVLEETTIEEARQIDVIEEVKTIDETDEFFDIEIEIEIETEEPETIDEIDVTLDDIVLEETTIEEAGEIDVIEEVKTIDEAEEIIEIEIIEDIDTIDGIEVTFDDIVPEETTIIEEAEEIDVIEEVKVIDEADEFFDIEIEIEIEIEEPETIDEIDVTLDDIVLEETTIEEAEEVDVIEEVKVIEEAEELIEIEVIEDIETIDGIEVTFDDIAPKETSIEEAEEIIDIEVIEEIETINEAEEIYKIEEAAKAELKTQIIKENEAALSVPVRKSEGLLSKAKKKADSKKGKGLLGLASKKLFSRKAAGKGLLGLASNKKAVSVKKKKGKGLLAVASGNEFIEELSIIETVETEKPTRGLLAHASDIEFGMEISDEIQEQDEQLADIVIISPFSSMFSSLNNTGKD